MKAIKKRSLSVMMIFIATGIYHNILCQMPVLVPQTGHISGVNTMAFSPDSRYLASCGNVGEIKLWEIATGHELRQFMALSFNALAFSPDGDLLAASGLETEKSKLTGSSSDMHFIRIWDVRSGALLQDLQLGDEIVHAVAFSSDGKVLAGAIGSSIQFWDARSGVKSPKTISAEFWITSIAYSRDGSRIAGTVGDARSKGIELMIWDSASLSKKRTLQGFEGSISFSKDGKEIVFSSNELKAYNLETGKITSARFPGYVAISPDEEYFAVAPFTMNIIERSNIEVFSITEKKKVADLVGSASFLAHSVSLTGLLLGVSGGGVTRVWSLERGDPSLQVDSGKVTSSVRFSPNGNQVAIVSFKDVQVGYTASKRQVFSTANATPITAVGFAYDSSQVAIGDEGGHISVWDLASGRLARKIETTGSIEALAYSHDNKNLLSGDSHGHLHQWSVSDGNEVRHYQKFDFGSGPQAHIFSVRGVAFSPDDRKVVSVDVHGAVGSWDAASGANLEYFLDEPTHSQLSVLLAAFPDLREGFGLVEDHRYQFKEDNGAVAIREYPQGNHVASILPLNGAEWLIFTPDGYFDGTPGAWKQMIWRFNNNTFDYGAVELYFNDYFYPNLLQDVMAGKVPAAKAGNELEKKDRRQPTVKIASVNGKPREQITAAAGPNSAQAIPERTLPVEVEVTDNAGEKKQKEWAASSGAQDLRLFRNGSLVKVWHGSVFDKASGCEQLPEKPNEPRRARCSVNVTLTAGDNELNAYAFNTSNVKSTDDTVTVKAADTIKRPGTMYVLAVGVNEYADTSYNLRYAVADVDEISKAVKQQQEKLTSDAKSRQYDRTEVVTLIDSDATHDNILLALKRFRDGDKAVIPATLSDKAKAELAKIKTASPEDAIIIYYAGHGAARDERFYLLPHDYNHKLEETGVSDIDLNQYLEGVDAGKLMLVIDACQSGAALGGKDEGRAPMNSKGLAQLAYDKGMLILTAAQSQQAALEAVTINGKTIEHGLLTYALLEVFDSPDADKNADGSLSDREWLDYATNEVPRLQLAAMKERNDANRGLPPSKRGAEIAYVNGDDKNVDPSRRKVQTPRVFYRREMDARPLILTRR